MRMKTVSNGTDEPIQVPEIPENPHWLGSNADQSRKQNSKIRELCERLNVFPSASWRTESMGLCKDGVRACKSAIQTTRGRCEKKLSALRQSYGHRSKYDECREHRYYSGDYDSRHSSRRKSCCRYHCSHAESRRRGHAERDGRRRESVERDARRRENVERDARRRESVSRDGRRREGHEIYGRRRYENERSERRDVTRDGRRRRDDERSARRRVDGEKIDKSRDKVEKYDGIKKAPDDKVGTKPHKDLGIPHCVLGRQELEERCEYLETKLQKLRQVEKSWVKETKVWDDGDVEAKTKLKPTESSQTFYSLAPLPPEVLPSRRTPPRTPTPRRTPSPHHKRTPSPPTEQTAKQASRPPSPRQPKRSPSPRQPKRPPSPRQPKRPPSPRQRDRANFQPSARRDVERRRQRRLSHRYDDYDVTVEADEEHCTDVPLFVHRDRAFTAREQRVSESMPRYELEEKLERFDHKMEKMRRSVEQNSSEIGELRHRVPWYEYFVWYSFVLALVAVCFYVAMRKQLL